MQGRKAPGIPEIFRKNSAGSENKGILNWEMICLAAGASHTRPLGFFGELIERER
jgi:hypothetical protein